MFLQIQLGLYIIVSFYCKETSGTPTITQSPDPVIEGVTVVLQYVHPLCQAPTTCTYSWSDGKTGKAISVAADRNIGSFSCTVTVNGTTTSSTTRDINVWYGPNTKPTVSMPALVQTENKALTSGINCTAPSCKPNCTIKWTKGSTIKNSPVLFANGALLNRSDAGTYTCNVSNSVGYNVASTVVTVLYGPDKVTISSTTESIKVIEGKANQLTCSRAACVQNCTLTWKKGGKELKSSQSSTLNLFGASEKLYRNHTGNYVCEGTNARAGIPSATDAIQVQIQFAPDDVALSFNNSTGVLKCSATGVPNFTFYAITQTVSNTFVRHLPLNVSDKTATVYVGTLDYQRTGNYSCTVQNGITSYSKNKINQTAALDVSIKDKPIFPQYEKTYNFSKGDPIHINLPVYSIPIFDNFSVEPNNRFDATISNKMVYGIMFFDKSISIAGQSLRLEINETLEEYFGSYTVTFRNSANFSELTFELRPKGPPDVPLKFEAISTSYDTVTFKVQSGFFNGASQTIFLEKKETSQTEWEISLEKDFGIEKNQEYDMPSEGLSQNTEYQFRVYSSNAFNRSDYSAVVEIKTSINAGMVAGIVIGGLAAIIIAIIIIVVVVKKMRKDDKPPPPIVPFTDIFSADNLENYENTAIRGTPNEYADSPTFTSGKTYENVENMGKPFEGALSQDSKGYITLENAGVQQAAPNDYYNTSFDKGLYANTNLVQDVATAGNFTPAAEKKMKGEEGYLTADKLKQDAEIKKEPAAYMNFSSQIQARLAKEKEAREADKDDYMEMNLNLKPPKKARESMPGFVAPLPPNTNHDQEEDYMNSPFPKVRKS
ncbi:protein turtle-like isoform X1 [Mya arenaria]|uniref:protein turtle-like isoform X1 n=1 Tax=Mya arenaria TaxID=6604 RepID=UPI0022E0E818|nr:protein turtle-like isoform X1 [Mya arenaria]